MDCIIDQRTKQVFLHGPVLESVQGSKLFEDEKDFTDMNMKVDPDVVLDGFGRMVKESKGKPPSKEQIRRFVEEYFDGPGADIELWTPTDWKEDLSFLKHITDQDLQEWATHLNKLWSKLCKKIKPQVSDHQERYNLIHLPNPIVVPGGRFREMFYWDTYWTMEGLLVCEMFETVKGLLLNFEHLIHKLGHIPNGNRFAFAERSQPPFICLMIETYVQKTGDVELLEKFMPALEKEYTFWTKDRTVAVDVNGTTHRMYRYWSEYTFPRPESYLADVDSADSVPTDVHPRLFRDIRAAAESGMDFSSRWIPNFDVKNSKLCDMRTTDIVPVCLNSLICMNEHLISTFFERLGDTAKSTEYKRRHEETKRAIRDVLWDDASGAWFDYRLSSKSSIKRFYPSNVYPVFCKCYYENQDDRIATEEKVFLYLKDCGCLDYIGGVPSSLSETGQQWDFPNAWAPMQHVVVMALHSMTSDEAKSKAKDLASRWLRNNYKAWKSSGNMYEKYDASKCGERGFGGEYTVQAGFGWSNGVVLSFMSTFGADVSLNS